MFLYCSVGYELLGVSTDELREYTNLLVKNEKPDKQECQFQNLANNLYKLLSYNFYARDYCEQGDVSGNNSNNDFSHFKRRILKESFSPEISVVDNGYFLFIEILLISKVIKDYL